MNERLLTTREVGEYLSLSPESVLRRWRRGEIPGGIRLSSNVLRFRGQAIEAWLAGLEAESARNAALTSVGPESDTAGAS